MKKRILTLIIAIACVMSMGMFASAGTIDFDITVTAHGASNPDPYSYREYKDDGEQRYYVTCTWMSHSSGYFQYRSCSADGRVISDNAATRYGELGRVKALYYGNDVYAPYNIEYYLEGLTALNGDSPYVNLNILGRYCP